MTEEKWQQIVGMIKDRFEVEYEGSEELIDFVNGKVEFIVFDGPLGKIKLEYETKPLILDKKTIGSRRIGSETTVEYVYSENEFSNVFKAYKLTDDEWIELAPEAAGAFSI